MRDFRNKAIKIAKSPGPFIVIMALLILFSNPEKNLPALASFTATVNIRKILEVILILLVISVVVLGLIVGYHNLDKEKQYAIIAGEEGGELRLEYRGSTFYLKIEDVERWRVKSLQNNLKK